jgi:hypothetical protein
MEAPGLDLENMLSQKEIDIFTKEEISKLF